MEQQQSGQHHHHLQPPPPSGQALHLVAALSNPEPADIHVQALRARDEALSASIESYGTLCLQLSYCLVGCDQPASMLSRIDPAQLEAWRVQDATTVARLQQDANLWIPFGQMAGLVLKNALLRPPATAATHASTEGHQPQAFPVTMTLQGQVANQVQQVLLYALGCQHAALRAVASSVIATTAVSSSHIQPALHARQWKTLVPTLIQNLQQQSSGNNSNHHPCLVQGSLATIRKMMEDGPQQLEVHDLDNLVPVLIQILSPSSNNGRQQETLIVAAMQSLEACVSLPVLPNGLVLRFNEYLGALSALADNNSSVVASNSPLVRQWVCKSIVTLLELRTEYIASHMASIAQFMLTSTADQGNPMVALAACEFWLTFCNLDENAVTADMMNVVSNLLPQLVPTLLQNMVYAPEQRAELQAQNELDMEAPTSRSIGGMKPIFHVSRAKQQQPTSSNNGAAADGDDSGYAEDDEGDDDDYDDEDDDDSNEWTLRKCSAASLDCLTNLCGAPAILPIITPCLQAGLANTSDPWIQEASILALGAIAEGCGDAMNAYMGQLHPYLMNHLSAPETLPPPPSTPTSLASVAHQQQHQHTTILPQLKSISAWTISRYAPWAIEQVQSGAQGHLLATMTEVFLTRLGDRNRRVQVAICSAFGIIVEAAGDLMALYLEHVYPALVEALLRYQGRSLILLFDVLGTIADCCGPSIAEENLPTLYMPALLQMFDRLGKNDPTDRILLPLMECLASTAMASGTNFQPYALECFENAMCVIESVQLVLATTAEEGIMNQEEDADPIVCAADLVDGLVEGMTESFPMLVSSSQRYGQHFLSVLHALCKHEIASVRMSALAIVGDLARNAPTVLEPALPQLLQEAIQSMDPIQPSVCGNAVWAIGEICVRCQGHAQILEPFAPTLVQNLIALLVGNGPGGDNRGVDVPGLVENAAACAGRLAKVNPNFIAPDLGRFLLGWCDGMAKVVDPTERRDAYEGFIQTVYANPAAIQQAGNTTDAIASILFAICTWHMPLESQDDEISPRALFQGEYKFRPFPPTETALGNALVRLVQDMKASAGEETWHLVQKALPVNVRRLLRENYQM